MTVHTLKEKVARFRTLFEGREAIYIEKGSLRVKVRNIRVDSSEPYARAEIEEIPTVGFPTGAICGLKSGEDLLRSSIGSSEGTHFSEHTWHAGYPTAFVLYFSPAIVEGLVNLASHFPDSLDPYQCYREVQRYLQDYQAQESTEDLFRKKKQ